MFYEQESRARVVWLRLERYEATFISDNPFKPCRSGGLCNAVCLSAPVEQKTCQEAWQVI